MRPLTAVVRDIEVPKGQPKGSVACDPQEVDAITRRAWGIATKGNQCNKNQLIHKFFKTYAEHIFVRKEVEMQPLTGTELKKTCCDASNSVAGLDHFAPKDLTLLSEACYEWIAALLNLVEE